MPPPARRFWEDVPLRDLSPEEWEALCDGCGKCCLHKLEDPDTGEIAFTDVACHLLDLETGRCRDYARRRILVPDCLRMTPSDAARFAWLPVTCAYRLRAGGKALPPWHYLVSGDREAVHRAGVSVRGRAVSEAVVIDIEDRIVDWTDL